MVARTVRFSCYPVWRSKARDMAEATPGQGDGKTGEHCGATPGEWQWNLRQQ
jgi:hypothetical protein